MATLTNAQINLTYPGLIKTTDNLAVGATVKGITDGVGTPINLQIGTSNINFPAGTVDFTGSTVLGLPIQPAGLEAGTGPDSMQSSATLTTNPSTATGQDAIAIGNGANASSLGISIGPGASTGNGPAISIGRNSYASGSVSTATGNSANVSADQSIGLSGEVLSISGARSVGIGRQVTVNGNNAIGIGNYAQVYGEGGMSFVSCRTNVNVNNAADTIMMIPGSWGCTVPTAAVEGIVIGAATSQLERLSAAAIRSGAIGYDTLSTAPGAFAIGDTVTAAIAQTVSVKELETQTVGGGITMYSPNGTAYKLTVSDAGALVIS